MSVPSASAMSKEHDEARASVANMLLVAAEEHKSRGVSFLSREAKDAEFMPYPALLKEAQEILGGLQSSGRRSGGKVVLLLEKPRDFIPAFWACILGAYVPCPVAYIGNDPERWANHLAHIDELLERPLFVCTDPRAVDLPTSVTSVALDDIRRGPRQKEVASAALTDVAALMLTSGSTGKSKAVELTHGNLFASMSGRAERQQLTSSEVTLNWIAFDHVAALLESHMIALFAGATQLHAEPATVLADPLLFLRIIDRYRVSLAFAPNFLLGQINAALEAAGGEPSEGVAQKLDLSGLKRIVTGGEANVVETGLRFLKLLEPYGLRRGALWPAFGMTETCAASVYSKEFPEIDIGNEFACVGMPIKGLEIRIVDSDGKPCGTEQPGELQVRGPMIFHRYFNNEDATRDAFTADGWFRTGDIGRVKEDRLSLVARNKDSIIVSGVNYYSQELETKLEQLDGIERSFVAAFPTRPKGADTEQLVVAVATTFLADQEADLYQLIIAIRNTTILLWGFRPAVVLLMPKDAFPKTSLGKIQRSLMRKRYEAGDYAVYAGSVREISSRQAGPFVEPAGERECAIAEVFCRILGIEVGKLSATASFFDLGGTSLDIMKFTRALERRFKTVVGLPIVLQNPSVRQLGQYLLPDARRSARDYDPIVPLQTTGKKTPLFCVHPGNGEVFVLTNVAKYFLNDRPFYALRPRGFNEGEERFQSFEEVIDAYVGAILRRQPQGPYAIAGYSLGCQWAFEVATELERRGRHVGFLGCIDHGPAWETTQLSFNMATGLALVIDLITLEQYLALNRELSPELPSDEVCDYVLSFASHRRLAELDIDRQRFAVWARVAHTMETLLFAHVNTGRVNAMSVFCSEGISPRYVTAQWTRPAWRAELERWSALVERPRYIDVAGDHHALMGPKHVAVFQATLRNEINLALGGW